MARTSGFIIVIMVAALFGAWYAVRQAPWEAEPAGGSEEREVRQVIADFGKKLNMVSLAAPKEIAARSIREQYAPFISPELLAAWEADPEKAPGRLTSNPYPDRIDIVLVEKEGDAYVVQGKVIEVTSSEPAKTAFEYRVAIKLRKQGDRWVITGFTKALPR